MSDQAKIVLTGRIRNIFPTEVVGNGFKKRALWLDEVDKEYPQTYTIEFIKDDTDTLDKFGPGMEVECHINLRGRHAAKGDKEYVFNSLQCWRIKKLADVPESTLTPSAEPAVSDLGYGPVASSDDLPF
jgi:hypothetical protein